MKRLGKRGRWLLAAGVILLALAVVDVWVLWPQPEDRTVQQVRDLLNEVRPPSTLRVWLADVGRRIGLDVAPVVAADPRQAAARLADWGPGTIPTLVSALADNEPRVRVCAALAFAKMGPEAKTAVPALMVALKDTDPEVRYCTALALGKIGPEARAAIGDLIHLTKDGDPVMRSIATGSLGRMGSEAEAAIPALIDALADTEPEVRLSATESLAWMGPEAKAAVAALIGALEANEYFERGLAAFALGQIGPDAEAATAMLEDLATKDSDDDVRAFARESLAKIRSPSTQPAASRAVNDLEIEQ